MSDEKALLAAIWEHPHEDTPRLVYADWLQENGQPERAEFIRVQCELARLGEWDDSPRKTELQKREEALWKKYAKQWKTGLPKLLQAAPFRRGFPHPRRRAATGSQFLKLTLDELAPAPLWDFSINQAQKTIVRVVASAAMARVGVLELPINEFMNRPAEVFAAANFPNLAHLQADANWIGGAGAAALVANPTLRNLRALCVYSGDLDDAAVAALSTAEWFSRLQALALGNNPFGAAGLRTLVAAAGAMRELGLGGLTVGASERRFDDESLAALFRSPRMASLRALDLSTNHVGDRLAELLCTEATTFRLRRLNLDNDALTDRGIELLAAWPGLTTVETLTLSGNRIGPRGALALARSPHLGRLRKLWLMYMPLATGPVADREPLVDRFGDAVWFDYRY
jgi:uncharacterized protein (TIGR02996 family)